MEWGGYGVFGDTINVNLDEELKNAHGTKVNRLLNTITLSIFTHPEVQFPILQSLVPHWGKHHAC